MWNEGILDSLERNKGNEKRRNVSYLCKRMEEWLSCSHFWKFASILESLNQYWWWAMLKCTCRITNLGMKPSVLRNCLDFIFHSIHSCIFWTFFLVRKLCEHQLIEQKLLPVSINVRRILVHEKVFESIFWPLVSFKMYANCYKINITLKVLNTDQQHFYTWCSFIHLLLVKTS